MSETVRTLKLEVVTDELITAKSRVTNLSKEIKDLSKNYAENKDEIAKKTEQMLTEKEAVKELTAIQKNKIIIEKNGADSIKGMRAQLALNTIELNKMTVAERETSVRGVELTKETKNLSDQLKKTEKSVGDTRREVGNYKDQTKEALAESGLFATQQGILSKAMATSKAVILLVAGAFKTLRGAIIATGIGALIVALGTLAAYFTRTEEGANKVKVVLAGIRGAIDVLLDRLTNFGEGLASIFSGEFKKGIKQIGDSFKGVGEEMKRETKQAAALQSQLNALIIAEREFLEVKEEQNATIAELRLAAKDEDASIKQRLESLDKAKELQEEINKKEVQFAKDRARIATEQEKMAISDPEAKQAAAEARAAASRAERDAAEQLRTIQTERLRLVRQVRGEESKAHDEKMKEAQSELDAKRKVLEEEQKLLLKKLEEDKKALEQFEQRKEEFSEMAMRMRADAQRSEMENELVRVEEHYMKLLDFAALYGEDEQIFVDELEKKKAEIRDKYREETTEAEVASLEMIRDVTADFLGQVAGLMKKDSTEQKLLLTAQAIMNTYTGATKALATLPPPASYIAAASTIASGLSSVAKINAVKFADGGLVPNAQNIPTQSNGDNVLATVKSGEVVLNEQQQQRLGGSSTFRKIGVPGFATGGRVGVSMRETNRQMNTQQVIKVVQVQSEFEKSQNTFKVAQTQGDF